MSSNAFETVLEKIPALASQDRGVHAVLFFGSAGAGMAQAARALARAWLGEEGSPALRSFDADRCVDFQLVEPWGAGHRIKESAISLAPTGQKDAFAGTPMREFFRTRPALARNKVMAFHGAHLLTPGAANAMLKTLEEPFPYAKVVLTTDSLGKVLPTIRSRCLCVPCQHDRSDSADPMTRVFGETLELAARVTEHPDPYQGLWALLESLPTAPIYAADGLAERFRETGEQMGKALGGSARIGHLEALRCAAAFVRTFRHNDPEILRRLAEAHRAVENYAAVGLVTDSLFVHWVGLGTRTPDNWV